MLADNSFMLEQFRSADEITHFYACHDITMAGVEGYKVTDVRFYIKDASAPLENFISLKYYNDDFLLVTIRTRDEGLIREAIGDILCAAQNGKQIEIRTPYDNIPEYRCLTDVFTLTPSDSPVSPIYGIRSRDDLSELVLPDGITVAPAAPEDKVEVEEAAKTYSFSEEEMGPWIFTAFPWFKNTRLYLIRENGKIVGYLRGECGYSNIYDIGWVGVSPEARGKGYGMALVLFFSYDCFDNGLVPHYGYAISPASARVAEKCGYFNTREKIYCVSVSGIKPEAVYFSNCP